MINDSIGTSDKKWRFCEWETLWNIFSAVAIFLLYDLNKYEIIHAVQIKRKF